MSYFPQMLSFPPSVPPPLCSTRVATPSLRPCIQSSDCDGPAGPPEVLGRDVEWLFSESRWLSPCLSKLPNHCLYICAEKFRGCDQQIKEKVFLFFLDIHHVQPQMTLCCHHRQHWWPMAAAVCFVWHSLVTASRDSPFPWSKSLSWSTWYACNMAIVWKAPLACPAATYALPFKHKLVCNGLDGRTGTFREDDSRWER